MSETMTQESFATRCQKVRQFAHNLYQRGPDWVTFFREVLGVSGAARKVFTSQEEFVAFEKSDEYGAIQQMVNGLRHRKGGGGTQYEPTRVITVRLPESLHEALKAEANDHNTSMNKLCISKLLQVLVEGEQPERAPAPAVRVTAPMPMAPRPIAPAASQSSPNGFVPRFGQAGN
jgi:predicted HicB family RNase H-like nuclease